MNVTAWFLLVFCFSLCCGLAQPLVQVSFPVSDWSVQTVDTAFSGSTWATQRTFTVTNTPPDIGLIADQRTTPGTAVSVPLTVSDAQSAPEQLAVSVTCTNPAILPPSGIVVSGNGSTRTLVLTPSSLRAGETWVRVTVSDPQGSFVYREFHLFVDQFVETELGFDSDTYVLQSSTADVDDDGDLDVFLSGGLSRGGTSYPRLLGRNQGNATFLWEPWTGTNDPLEQVEWANSSHSWLDWHRDGKLDLVVCAGGSVCVFQNLGSGFVALPRVTRVGGFGGVVWNDFNHDGLVDGLHGNSGLEVLRQEGPGRFLGLPKMGEGLYFNGWVDFDADGWADLLGGPAFHKQGENSFLPTTNNLEATFTKDVGDLDGDGDIDVLGGYNTDLVLSVNSGGTFQRRAFPGFVFANMFCGDFDHDGINDILFSQGLWQYSGSPARVAINNGTATSFSTNNLFSTAASGTLLPGDFDKDGDLDVISTGGTLRLVINGLGQSNAPPSAPALVAAASQTNDTVLLTWNRSTDDHTPAAGLTYEVRVTSAAVGATPDALASFSDPGTGYRRVLLPGTAGARTNYVVRDLPAGQYTWHVQAIDSAFAASAWSTAGSFTVSNPMLGGLMDTRTPGGVASHPILFTVSSATFAPHLITVTATADDAGLVPPGAIQISGSGADRSLVITPALTNGLVFIRVNATDPLGYSDVFTFRLYVEAFSPEQVATPFTGSWAYNAISAWCDFDSDGDLDLATYGSDAGKRVSTLLFRNPGNGVLQSVTNVAYDMGWDTMLPGDYDHDNVPDLLFCGGVTPRIAYWSQGRADFAMEPVTTGLSTTWRSRTIQASSWLDTGNDGARDLVWFVETQNATDRTYSFPFKPAIGFGINPRTLLEFRPASWVWADFDRDGDADLVTTFRDNMGFKHVYFHANTQTGLLSQVEIPGAPATGHLSVNDFDADGWPDFLLLENVPRLFKNLRTNSFLLVTNTLPQGAWSTASWGDLNNDGLQDVVLTSGGYTAAFRNLGQGQFEEMPAPLPTVHGANVALADADNDGDLDFILNDGEHYEASQWLCRNQVGTANTPPGTPTNLHVTREPAGFVLRWSASTDAETPLDALTYSVRLGTTPGGSEVLSALADPVNGSRFVVGPGNAGTCLFLPLNHLPRGPLYWTVQAVDGAYAGGRFAPEQVYQDSPPTISTIPDLPLAPNVLAGPVAFDVGDAQTPRPNLQWNVISYNECLVPSTNVFIQANSTGALFHVTPARHQSGSADLIFTVTDQDGQWVGVRFTISVPEEFTMVQTNFPALDRGSAAWGDIDGDGDLDLLTAGFTYLPFLANSGRTDLWRNDGGVLNTNPVLTFADGGAGSVNFVDIDRDGDLDFSACGGTVFTRLFWQTSPGSFSQGTLTGVNRAAMAWGDRDGDGDTDLVIGGNIANQAIADSRTYLFNNINGSFASSSLAANLRDGSAEWIDVDNDGDNDLFLTGSTTWYPGAAQTILYRNLNGVLSAVETGLPAVSDSAHAFADFDLDGDPDLALCGRNASSTVLYLNDGAGNFSPYQTNLPAYAFGNLAWADFDQDGDPDLVISGIGPQDARTELWHNDGGVLRSTGNTFDLKSGRGLAWGDLDSDGDLDLAIVGSPDDGFSPPRIPYFTGVFRNDLDLAPMPLPAPIPSSLTVAGSEVTFAWTLPPGAPAGLSYNLRVGTMPYTGNIMSAPANPATGQLLTPMRGNAGWSGTWRLHNLPNGTYYWSVQAVGPACQASSFAPVSSFTIPPSTPMVPRFTGMTNLGGGQCRITATGQPNRYVILESSTDLQLWAQETTLNFNGQGTLTWTAAISPGQRFLRLRQP